MGQSIGLIHGAKYISARYRNKMTCLSLDVNRRPHGALPAWASAVIATTRQRSGPCDTTPMDIMADGCPAEKQARFPHRLTMEGKVQATHRIRNRIIDRQIRTDRRLNNRVGSGSKSSLFGRLRPYKTQRAPEPLSDTPMPKTIRLPHHFRFKRPQSDSTDLERAPGGK